MILAGIYEIADLAGVSSQAIIHWRKRYADFPQPVQILHMGPVFDFEAVRDWITRTEVVRTQFRRIARA